MTKTVSANLLAELSTGAPNLTTCWRIVKVDGTELGFTEWPYSFDYQSTDAASTITYQASTGYQKTAISQKEGLNVDNLNLVGLITSTAITEEALLTDEYQNAEVWIFAVNPYELGWGEIPIDYGTIGQISVKETTFIAEFRSLSHKLQQKLGNKYSRYCRHKLGSSKLVSGIEVKCGIILEPPDRLDSTLYEVGEAISLPTYDGRRYVCTVEGTTAATIPSYNTTIGQTTVDGTATFECYDAYTKEGTVDSVTSDFIFSDSNFTQVNDWFKYGILTFTSGPNLGKSFDVKDSTNTGQFTLRKEPYYTVAIGHTFKVSVGCNHILKMPTDTKGTAYTGDCRVKFGLEFGGNAKNYGGEPELENLDRISTPAGNT